MKRRSLPRTNHDNASASRRTPSWRGGESSAKLRAPVKKLVKKKTPSSAASSTVGLKKETALNSDGEVKSSGDEMYTIDHVEECQRLREQLERVLGDHQRQEEEIVALRALAKALKEEVELIHEEQKLKNSMSSGSSDHRFGSHEFFKLEVEFEQLQSENAELRRQFEISQDEAKYARACVAQKLPTYKLAAVKANAELRCVKSQLQQERAHSDRLQEQLVRYKARRDDVPARVFPHRGNNQDEDDDISLQESEHVRRERDKFLRQCKSLQVIKPTRGKMSAGSMDGDNYFQATDARQVRPESLSDFAPDDHINGDLHGASLSPMTSPTSSKSS